MEQNYDKERELLKRYNEGLTTPQENLLIEHSFNIFAKSSISPDNDIDEDAIGKRIHSRLPISRPTTKKLWIRIAAAASISAILGIGVFYYIQRPQEQEIIQLVQDIKPGGNKAYLTLGNGKKISLTDAANGNIAQQAGVTIKKTTDGQLVYEINAEKDQTDLIIYNTIETPKGGQYQVRLPDGTVVWLNAASNLKYPSRFAANGERRVQLFGEAYLEVAKDKNRPFIVASAGQEVEVLGTHFNIRAYGDENAIKTTLLEGSVRVSSLQDKKQTRILKPSEEATNSQGSLMVHEVEADLAIEWKNGYFRFDGKDVGMAMKEIARWYDVEVEFGNQALKNEPIAGRISKYTTIKQVLKKLELTGNIKFTIKGRLILVE